MAYDYKKGNCSHDAAKRVFAVGKAQIWAGDQAELLLQTDWSLIISAVGFTEFSKNPISASPAAKLILPEHLLVWKTPPCVGIDWTDNNAPTMGRQWWKDMTTFIRGLDGHVGLCCYAGHGRTGTMLSILAVLFGKVKKGDCPVAWVRKRYCKRAVESTAQLDYIERITGVTVFSEPSTASLAWPSAKGGTGTVNPTTIPKNWGANTARDKPETVTPSGYDSGETLTADSSDEELMSAWVRSKDDELMVAHADGTAHYLEPVWDKSGELAGWQDVT